jgi:hypothetical protein
VLADFRKLVHLEIDSSWLLHRSTWFHGAFAATSETAVDDFVAALKDILEHTGL